MWSRKQARLVVREPPCFVCLFVCFLLILTLHIQTFISCLRPWAKTFFCLFLFLFFVLFSWVSLHVNPCEHCTRYVPYDLSRSTVRHLSHSSPAHQVVLAWPVRFAIIKGRLQNRTASWVVVLSGSGWFSLFNTIETSRNWTELDGVTGQRRLGFEVVSLRVDSGPQFSESLQELNLIKTATFYCMIQWEKLILMSRYHVQKCHQEWTNCQHFACWILLSRYLNEEMC